MTRRLATLMLSLMLTATTAVAQAVIFPQEQQAGTAVATQSGDVFTLKNDLFEASFRLNGGRLMFDGCEAMGLKPGTELFTIR